MKATPSSSFLSRHEFLIRRLHSLSGLIPVGAYMVVHLITNASLLESPATFQNAVYSIHSLGSLLPVVEWAFIFIPLLFHAIFGVVIVFGGLPNNATYRYGSNVRYVLQRITGIIAFVFIMVHVFHMHGWFHFDWWLEGLAKPLGGAQFKPYNAASTVGQAMGGFGYPLFYGIGVVASVYHLANGIWTMGITWGVWITPDAQRRASWVCAAFGLGLLALGGAALTAAVKSSWPEEKERAVQIEDDMFKAKVDSGQLDGNSELVKHKRSEHAAEPPADPAGG